jgi:DNA-directed RNA polymerase alpha subunit
MTKKELESKIEELENLFEQSQQVLSEIKQEIRVQQINNKSIEGVLAQSIKTFFMVFNYESGLSKRAYKVFDEIGCKTIDDVVKLTTLDIYKSNVGDKTVAYIQRSLAKYGLSLKTYNS